MRLSIDDHGSGGERAEQTGGVVLPFSPHSRPLPPEREDPAPRQVVPLVPRPVRPPQAKAPTREKLEELEQEMRNLQHEYAQSLADLAAAVPARQANAIRVIAQRIAFGFGGLLRQAETLADLPRLAGEERPD